ncbi:hypothetical protein [Nocardia tengchongensis]|uniref:hypothetical protein n=1 Tax=Nocardia tengchongensis TaxID=2055889 RepID=UPI00365F305B
MATDSATVEVHAVVLTTQQARDLIAEAVDEGVRRALTESVAEEPRSMPTIIDQALADMRAGLRVLIVAPSDDAITTLLTKAMEQLREGERAQRSHQTPLVFARPARRSDQDATLSGSDGGWIRFCRYMNRAAARGFTVDRIYVDHAELWDRLAPTMVGSIDGPVITHC